MTRAISLSFVVLAALVANAAARPSIAVLGLEVVDPSGTPTQADTQVAKELTEGLRSRAKAGSGPYSLAPGSDKELIDEKLLTNCETEQPACMAQIGQSVGAEFLMYGKIEKQGKAYQVTLNLLDVKRKAREKSLPALIPLSQANGAGLSGWAKNLYANITGQATAAGIVVKVANADRCTVLIDGEEKGNVNNGVGQINGIEDGSHKLGVECPGYRKYEQDITVKAGETTQVPVRVEKTETGPEGGVGPGGVTGTEGPGPSTGGGGGGETGSSGWRSVFYGSLAVGVAGGALWIAGYHTESAASDRLCAIGGYVDPKFNRPDCQNPPEHLPDPDIQHENDRGDKGKLMTEIGIGAAVVGGSLAVVALYEGFIAKKDSNPREHALRSHRVHRDRFVVTPIISPSGGGATLQLSW